MAREPTSPITELLPSLLPSTSQVLGETVDFPRANTRWLRRRLESESLQSICTGLGGFRPLGSKARGKRTQQIDHANVNVYDYALLRAGDKLSIILIIVLQHLSYGGTIVTLMKAKTHVAEAKHLSSNPQAQY